MGTNSRVPAASGRRHPPHGYLRRTIRRRGLPRRALGRRPRRGPALPREPAARPPCSPPPTPPPPTVSARPSRTTACSSSSVRPEPAAIAARPTPSTPTSRRPAPFPRPPWRSTMAAAATPSARASPPRARPCSSGRPARTPERARRSSSPAASTTARGTSHPVSPSPRKARPGTARRWPSTGAARGSARARSARARAAPRSSASRRRPWRWKARTRSRPPDSPAARSSGPSSRCAGMWRWSPPRTRTCGSAPPSSTSARTGPGSRARPCASRPTRLAAWTALTGEQAPCTDGATGPFDCSQIDLVAFVPLTGLGADPGTILNDIWGWTDPVTGRDWALVGRSDATAFVDISDPAGPRYAGELPLTEGAIENLWRDIKVYQDHAFIVADGAGSHGVQIFDLTQLRDATGPPVTFAETAHYDGIASAHNIVINEEDGDGVRGGEQHGRPDLRRRPAHDRRAHPRRARLPGLLRRRHHRTPAHRLLPRRPVRHLPGGRTRTTRATRSASAPTKPR